MKTFSKITFLTIMAFSLLLIISLDFYLRTSNEKKVIANLKDEAHKTVLLSKAYLRNTKFFEEDSLTILNQLKQISEIVEQTIVFVSKEGKEFPDLTEGNSNNKVSVLNQPDIKSAMKGEFGIYRSSNNKSGEEVFYYSESIKNNGLLIGFIRISFPYAEYSERLNSINPIILFSDLLILFFSLLLYIIVNSYFQKQFRMLITPMKNSFKSKHFEVIPPQKTEEFQELATAFNHFANCLIEKNKKLKKENLLIVELLNSLEEGIAAFDEESFIIFHTDNFQSILQLELNSEKLHIYDFIDFPPLINDIRKFLIDKKPITRKIKYYGNKFIEYAILPISLEANKPGFTIVVRDISEIRQLEKIRTDFVANVSHEFKTPLTSIRGFAETLLSNKIEDEKLRERFLLKIKKQTDYLENLVTDLLKLNRIEKGEAVELEPIPILPIVKEIIEEFTAKAEMTEITLEFKNNISNDVIVLANENLIRNTLSNLISNAFQYSPSGGVVKVSVNVEEAFVKFEVKDEGIGISAKEQPRIFERFYRTKEAKDMFSTGSGLGLSIVKNAVELLKGDYGVESQLGKGSAFWCKIPIII